MRRGRAARPAKPILIMSSASGSMDCATRQGSVANVLHEPFGRHGATEAEFPRLF